MNIKNSFIVLISLFALIYGNIKDFSGHIINGEGHPLINCELGKYFDHLKGVRKSEGRSRKRDLLQPRNETYWNEV